VTQFQGHEQGSNSGSWSASDEKDVDKSLLDIEVCREIRATIYSGENRYL
jgi:hypothetical protein